jgi:hypothetical protein
VDPKHLFVDDRLTGRCVYCGGRPDTADHVPSRIFLDDPLPENLPVVEACRECNGGFSLDEEYLACLLECVIAGTTETDVLARKKVKRALLRNPRLTAQLKACRWDDLFGRQWWRPDEARVRNVVLKLAKGHTAYELNEVMADEPDFYSVRAIPAMSEAERQEFECIGGEAQFLWPELGSRAFLRASGRPIPPTQDGAWLIVQPRRYRYSIDWQSGIDVRMVIGEYLYCRAVWNR